MEIIDRYSPLLLLIYSFCSFCLPWQLFNPGNMSATALHLKRASCEWGEFRPSGWLVQMAWDVQVTGLEINLWVGESWLAGDHIYMTISCKTGVWHVFIAWLILLIDQGTNKSSVTVVWPPCSKAIPLTIYYELYLQTETTSESFILFMYSLFT